MLTRLSVEQKKILQLLSAYPNLTILELEKILHGISVTPGTKEYNAMCRNLYLLEAQGLIEKENDQIKWHIKPKTQ